MNRLTFTKEFKKHEEIGRILCLKPEKLIEWEEKLSQYEDIGEPKELIKRPSLDENGLAQCEPAYEWVRTTDRLPMVEQVVVGLCGGKVDIYQMVNIDDFKRYVEYWCALPLLPEVEG